MEHFFTIVSMRAYHRDKCRGPLISVILDSTSGGSSPTLFQEKENYINDADQIDKVAGGSADIRKPKHGFLRSP